MPPSFSRLEIRLASSVGFNNYVGHNATVFAYGQTGSGKTHTINGTRENPGIIPRTIKYLLAQIHEDPTLADAKVTINVSYLEIYNEKIFDLLCSERIPSQGLDLRETAEKTIVVAGLSKVEIKTVSEFEKHHEIAIKHRSTASTKLNEHSSRSHFVMQIMVETSRGNRTLHGKLHLIDLAGSEDNKRTGNVGTRLVESGAINKSLFVLGQVVEAVNRNLSRVPYRDSKITRFLQDSLGGTALGMCIRNTVVVNEEIETDRFSTGKRRSSEDEYSLTSITNPKSKKIRLSDASDSSTNSVTNTNTNTSSSSSLPQPPPLYPGTRSTRGLGAASRIGASSSMSSASNSAFVNPRIGASSSIGNSNTNVVPSGSTRMANSLAAKAGNQAGSGVFIAMDESQLEKRVQELVERRIQHFMAPGRLLSPMLRKKKVFEQDMQDRLEGLEKKLKMKTHGSVDSNGNEDSSPSFSSFAIPANRMTPSTRTKTAQAFVDEGRDLLLRGGIGGAVENFRRALSILPPDHPSDTRVLLEKEIKGLETRLSGAVSEEEERKDLAADETRKRKEPKAKRKGKSTKNKSEDSSFLTDSSSALVAMDNGEQVEKKELPADDGVMDDDDVDKERAEGPSSSKSRKGEGADKKKKEKKKVGGSSSSKGRRKHQKNADDTAEEEDAGLSVSPASGSMSRNEEPEDMHSSKANGKKRRSAAPEGEAGDADGDAEEDNHVSEDKEERKKKGSKKGSKGKSASQKKARKRTVKEDDDCQPEHDDEPQIQLEQPLSQKQVQPRPQEVQDDFKLTREEEESRGEVVDGDAKVEEKPARRRKGSRSTGGSSSLRVVDDEEREDEDEDEDEDDDDYAPSKKRGAGKKRSGQDRYQDTRPSKAGHDKTEEQLDYDSSNHVYEVTASVLKIMNTGTKKALIGKLRGVGDKRAQSIIDWREGNGPFVKIEDLRNAGFTQKQIAAILKDGVK
ncbi:Kinesin-like protein kif22 [Quaeritorhiza haematococci]|nr:Kinesin-like protein kif22 [Quaeritorhiza haematococci]